MKKLVFCLVFYGLLPALLAYAGDCNDNSVVQIWLAGKEEASKKILRHWAQGGSLDEVAREIAVVISNEMYILGVCRDYPDFLREKLLIYGARPNPGVDSLPALILERIAKKDILSPRRDFPGLQNEGGLK